VLNKRATWLDEGQSAKLITGPSINLKEETHMIDDNVYPANDNTERPIPTMPEVDALLMHQAKQNVKDKRNLARHIIAYIAAWPALGIFFAGIIQNMQHPRWWNIQNILEETRQMPSSHTPTYHSAVHDLSWTLEAYFRHNYVHPIWYVITGIMLAWGGWIVFRIAKRAKRPILERFWSIARKKVKPDPIIQEYNRLKNMMADDTI